MILRNHIRINKDFKVGRRRRLWDLGTKEQHSKNAAFSGFYCLPHLSGLGLGLINTNGHRPGKVPVKGLGNKPSKPGLTGSNRSTMVKLNRNKTKQNDSPSSSHTSTGRGRSLDLYLHCLEATQSPSWSWSGVIVESQELYTPSASGNQVHPAVHSSHIEQQRPAGELVP